MILSLLLTFICHIVDSTEHEIDSEDEGPNLVIDGGKAAKKKMDYMFLRVTFLKYDSNSIYLMSIFLFKRIKRPRRHHLDRVLSMSKSTRNARTAQLFELVLIFLDSFNIISRNIFVCRLKFSLLKIIRNSLFLASAQILNRTQFLMNHMAIMPLKCFIQALASSLSKNLFLVGLCLVRITLLEWKRTQRIRTHPLHLLYPK